MTTIILSGNEVAKSIYSRNKEEISRLKGNGIIPQLAGILIGDNPASQIYIKRKTEKFNELGLISSVKHFSTEATENAVIQFINELNHDSSCHGILVQLPLPKRFNVERIINSIDPRKDVDGFHYENIGRLVMEQPRFIPCTPKGVREILSYYNIQTERKNVVILGRSSIVGRPLSLLLSAKPPYGNATVTICHSYSDDMQKLMINADICISAIGKPSFVTGDMIKEGCVVIDVGINRVTDSSSPKGYKIIGDVNFDSVLGKAYAVTPVPGGVGPVTIAMLVENTIFAAKDLSGIST